jgi:hypothetical protein
MVPLTIGLVVLIVALIALGAMLSRRAATTRASTAPGAQAPSSPPARSEPITKRLASQLTPPRPARPGGYDWDRPTHQLYRAWKRVPGPDENRDAIMSFLDAHTGVEAFVEPRTVMHPLSVVLVDADGRWARFELKEDVFLRGLASERAVPVFDASRVGYPSRMRRHRVDDEEDEDRP